MIGKDQLENDLLDWQRATAAQKTEALLWGLKLARAQAWLTAKPRQLTAPERAFIEASVQYAAARRRMHMLRTMGALVGGLCLLFGIAIAYQVSKKHEAVAAEKAARLTTSETDLAFAAEEMERGDTPVSLAFLGDALDKNPQNASAIALAIAECVIPRFRFRRCATATKFRMPTSAPTARASSRHRRMEARACGARRRDSKSAAT